MNIDKLFRIKCNKCNWVEFSSGLSKDLAHLREIKKCSTCGGPRKFKCLKCGLPCKMTRMARNEDVK